MDKSQLFKTNGYFIHQIPYNMTGKITQNDFNKIIKTLNNYLNVYYSNDFFNGLEMTMTIAILLTIWYFTIGYWYFMIGWVIIYFWIIPNNNQKLRTLTKGVIKEINDSLEDYSLKIISATGYLSDTIYITDKL